MMGTVAIILLFFISKVSLQRLEPSPFPADSHYSMNINMPDVKPTNPDAYLCTARKLDSHEAYIVKYDPDVSVKTAHHMLLFGCKDLIKQEHLYPTYWDCAHGDLCSHMTIMYGWAKNAPPMELPKDVGYLIGGNSSINYVVLQIHYAKPLSEGSTDNSGLKLHLTTQRQRFITGIRLLLADSARIPPRLPKYDVDVNCKFEENYKINPFAFRVHTHKLGVVVSAYVLHPANNSWVLIAKGNPQWPQAFYPVQFSTPIAKGDILAARCVYNSSQTDRAVKIGSSSNDEMCNLYLMYFTEYRNAFAGQSPPCVGTQFHNLIDTLPRDSEVPLPRDEEKEQRAYGNAEAHYDPTHLEFNIKSDDDQSAFIPDSSYSNAPFGLGPGGNGVLNNEYMYQEVPSWPSKDLKFGQVAAVTVDVNGNVVIFHRGDHVWNELTFDDNNNYLLAKHGPIKTPTILVIDSASGLVLQKWGSDLFYMPHGLFINTDGSFWVTDVALHQVFRFAATDLKKPTLTLGVKFMPGNDKTHFCKPASVAVSKTGDIFVADGYCNSRIVKFSSKGTYLSHWGKPDNKFEILGILKYSLSNVLGNPPVGSFRIPHKVVLLEDRDLACVADRENGRIQCFAMDSGRFRFQIQREEFGGTLYSIAYSQEKGLLLAVCGPSLFNKDHMVRAFVFNITDQRLLNVFAPHSGSFTRPHDIAITPNGNEAYVCEIGPNVIWRFLRIYHKSTKKILDLPGTNTHNVSPSRITIEGHVVPFSEGDKAVTDKESDSSGFQTSIIIMCLLAIPILCFIIVSVILRLKRRGKFQQSYFGNLKGWWGGYKTPHPQDKFNLGSLLNPHKGFDRVSLEESDAEGDDGSESDIEEFSAIARKT